MATQTGDAPRGVTVRESRTSCEVVGSLRHPRVMLAWPGTVILLLVLGIGLAVDFGGIVETYGPAVVALVAAWCLLGVAPMVLLTAGRVRVTVTADEVRLSTGLGPLALRRRVALRRVARADAAEWFAGDWVRPLTMFIPTEQIVLYDSGGVPLVRFGLLLTYKRRRHVLDCLARCIQRREGA